VLDPLIAWIKSVFMMIAGWIKAAILAVTAPFRYLYNLYRRSGWILRILIFAMAMPFVLGYLWFFWNAAWIRNHDINYPDTYNFTQSTVAAGDQVSVEGGDQTTRTCGRSYVVDVTADLIDFNVNQNMWMSSNPFYKAGLFWMLDWDQTWFLDNKAAFQRGVHQAASRTAIELADALGRVRGTSQIDPDLKVAKGNVQFDQYTWYFNLFDDQPFGPTTPSPTYFRSAIEELRQYNDRLEGCSATFDARADNLLQFLDRVAKDIGSMSAEIKDRSEGFNSGWFDTRADDIFMYAQGQLYAYYGILRAARTDFGQVVSSRELSDIWDRMEDHVRRAIELDPLVISNGAEDGWLMPTHLTTIGFYILRARSNLVEIRSVLDR
jgi:hypothetical protein